MLDRTVWACLAGQKVGIGRGAPSEGGRSLAVFWVLIAVVGSVVIVSVDSLPVDGVVVGLRRPDVDLWPSPSGVLVCLPICIVHVNFLQFQLWRAGLLVQAFLTAHDLQLLRQLVMRDVKNLDR